MATTPILRDQFTHPVHFSLRDLLSEVSLGAKADIGTCPRNVCFTPKADIGSAH